MPSCDCALERPKDGSYGSWVAEIEKRLAGRKPGAGRPKVYPQCTHSKPIRLFTDGTSTIPSQLIPKYKPRKLKTEAEAAPQKRKATAEAGGSPSPALKKQKVQPEWAEQEGEAEAAVGNVQLPAAPKLWAEALSRTLSTLQHPNTREKHAELRFIHAKQRAKGERQFSPQLVDIVLYKGASRSWLYKQLLEGTRKFTCDRQLQELNEGKRSKLDEWEVFPWEKGDEVKENEEENEDEDEDDEDEDGLGLGFSWVWYERAAYY